MVILALGGDIHDPEPRSWADLRRAVVGAVTAVTGDAQAAPRIADAVLAVCGQEAIRQMVRGRISPSIGEESGTAGLSVRDG